MAVKTNIKPLNDYLLIQPLEKETTTPSGIILTDSAKEKPVEGTIVALGPGKLNEKHERVKLSLKVGDIVIYRKWDGNSLKTTEIKVEGKEMLLVKEEDILAVIEK